MTILEHSKHHMYDFYYNFIKKEYGNNAELCYTDTDSFILNIKTDDVYDDFKTNSHLFDFSGYPSHHKCFDVSNKKVLGKFKDELNGSILKRFLGLKAKMYCVEIEDEDEKIEK
jgi:hypothetical protein